MALEGTIKTPAGPMKKQTAVLVGAGGAVVIGIVWYRSKQNASSSGADTSTDPNAIDPNTGYPYGTLDDSQASLDGTGYMYPPLSGSGYDYSGGYGYSPGPGSGVPQGPGTFTSNPQWAQYAEQYLVENTGAEPNIVGNALGKYITGGRATAEQQAIIEQAITFAGFPPQAGPAGAPPAIITDPGGPSPGGGGSGNKVTVPRIVGLDLNQADDKLKAAGLAFNAHPAPPKKGFVRRVTAQTPKAGAKVKHGTRVAITWHYERQGK